MTSPGDSDEPGAEEPTGSDARDPSRDPVPERGADDPTPPSGLPAAAPDPGEVVPGRTTAAAPAPVPGTAWPHPGYQSRRPPPGPRPTAPPGGTWPQTAPGPPDPARAARRRLRRLVAAVLLGLVVVAAIVVALLAFLVGPRFARYDVLDHTAVERGVTDVVTRDWHRRITDVTCPEGERVRRGVSFVCRATVDGTPQRVPVDVVDEHGGYEVGQPR